MFDNKRLKTAESLIKDLQAKVDANAKFALKKSDAKIVPQYGLINEIYEYQNGMNSYNYDTFTEAQATTAYANSFVQSKLSLKLNKALAFNKAFNWDGVNKNIAKFVEDDFMPNFKWRDFAEQINFSKVYGRAVIRIFWNEETNLIEKTEGLDQRLFTYNNDYSKGDIGDLIYNNINLTKDYPYNFMVFYNRKDPKNPFGQSELKSLYPTIMFFNLLSKIEARYFNKAAVPAFVAGYESTENDATKKEEEATNITDTLAQIENGSGVAIANLKSFYALASNGQVNFNSTFERLENTIAIRILGSDMTDSKKNGTYAQAKVGDEYIDGNVKDDAVEIQDASNLLIKWQVWALYGIAYKAPQFLYDMQMPYGREVWEFMAKYKMPVSAKSFCKEHPTPIGWQMPADDILIIGKDVLEVKEQSPDKSNDSDSDSEDDK